MTSTNDTSETQAGCASASWHLRRVVDRCVCEGIAREQVAEALLRMAEAVTSEIAEERAAYAAYVEAPEGIDRVPLGTECACGLVYSAEQRHCARCGSPLAPSLVPKAIPGKLQFNRRVGKGGAGVVYEAIDLSLGRRTAVKTLPTLSSMHDVARLRREAQALAMVPNRGLATVYGFEVYRGTPMIIMEYVDGGMLADRIPLPLDDAIDVMLKVTEIVGCLHDAGVVHRDIKPRNIAFTGAGELKLLDFGLARLENEATLSGVAGRAVVGTPAYLSPEAHGHERANPSFDLWAISIAFYETLTGRRPFETDSRETLVAAIKDGRWKPIERHLPGCPALLRSFFSVALAADIALRPSSASELARQLVALRHQAVPRWVDGGEGRSSGPR